MQGSVEVAEGALAARGRRSGPSRSAGGGRVVKAVFRPRVKAGSARRGRAGDRRWQRWRSRRGKCRSAARSAGDIAATRAAAARRVPVAFRVLGDPMPNTWDERAPSDYPVHGINVSRWQAEIDCPSRSGSASPLAPPAAATGPAAAARPAAQSPSRVCSSSPAPRPSPSGSARHQSGCRKCGAPTPAAQRPAVERRSGI